MEDLNDVLSFVRVAERMSFSAAARLLGVPKSTVSRRIARLEVALNARLLQRSTRRVMLTEVGRRYFEQCRPLLQGFEAAASMVAGFQAEPAGMVRVTAPVILGQAFLAPVVQAYLERYPHAQCSLELSNRRVDLIEEGMDVALRIGTLVDSTLRQRSLGAVATALFASPAYVERNGLPADPSDLVGHTLLELAVREADPAWRLHRKNETVEIAIRPRLISSDVDILRQAALAGRGIARLPTFEAEPDAKARRLRRALPEWRSRAIPVTMLFPSHKSLSPTVRAFMDLVVQELRLPDIDD